MSARDYSTLARLAEDQGFRFLSRMERMERSADLLWDQFSSTGVSWVGYYTAGGINADVLDLGPHRDKPACTPIGLHGACGQAYLSGEPVLVSDVRLLGDNYIACDPRDLSEVVMPIRDPSGMIWGVLDLDSCEVDSFSVEDVEGLKDFIRIVFQGVE